MNVFKRLKQWVAKKFRPYSMLDAYKDECEARGVTDVVFDSSDTYGKAGMKPGMILRYQCGCEHLVGHVGYGWPCPPPLLCRDHGHAWVLNTNPYKWPEEWKQLDKQSVSKTHQSHE
jgi:hypothetical protein